jgi:hypothetical protein
VNCVSKFALIFAATLMAQPIHAQSTPKPTPETAMTKLGSITGRVLVDGQAGINASVAVTRVNATTASRFVPTNDNGDFEAKGLDAGVYRIGVTAPGYVTLTSSDQETYYRVGDSVTVTMLKGGVITGKVLGADDEPVVAVRVRAIRIRDESGKSVITPDLNFDRLTDDRGIYRVFGLRPGTYVVSAGGRGSSEYGINGYDHDVPIYAPSSTRDTAAQISLGSGEEKTIDIHYRREAGHVVSGNATAPAGPNSPWISINLARLIDGAPDVKMSTYQNAGAKGFEFSGVADGEYLIWAQYAPTTGDPFASEPRRITVKGADVTGIELTAKPLATVAGEFVLVPSTAESCKGKRQPSFDQTVIAIQRKPKTSTKEEPELPSYGAGRVTADKSGNFVLRGLAPGQYGLEVRFFARYWYLQSITQRASAISKETTNQTSDLARSWLTLRREGASGVKVTLAEGAAAVAGQVEKPDNQPLPASLFVYLVPAEKDKADDVLRYSAVRVDADGSFALDQVTPGRYWLITKVAADNNLAGIKDLRSPAGDEARAKLRREAESAKSEVELKPCQNVIGYKLLLK